jgi:hypothetical protein
MSKKTIESNLKENLSGDALTNALDFTAYLKNMGMTAAVATIRNAGQLK